MTVQIKIYGCHVFMVQKKKVFSFYEAFLTIGVFLVLLIYGLLLHPQFLNGDGLPVEVLVLMALCFNSYYLMYDDPRKEKSVVA